MTDKVDQRPRLGETLSLLGRSRGDRLGIEHPRPVDVEDEVDRLVRVSVRGARRIIIALVGTTVLLAGVAMLVLPGPGLVVIPIGLAVLSTEFVWARRWLARVREGIDRNNPLGSRARAPDPKREA